MLFLHLRDRKKNNKGFTIITVIITMALVITLVTTGLTTSLLNYYMKTNNRVSTDNFYDAEAALEEVRMGLAQEVSEAASTAYVTTLQAYSQYDTDKRSALFESTYATELMNNLAIVPGESSTYTSSSYYSRYHLSTLFRDTKYDTTENYGATIVTLDGENIMNVTDDGIVLKNVKVRYLDKKAYVSEIHTDIVMAFPDIDFAAVTTMPDIINYALIANTKFESRGDNKITGKAYLGKAYPGATTTTDETTGTTTILTEDDYGAHIESGKITFENLVVAGGETTGQIITGGSYLAKSGSTSNFKDDELWVGNLTADSSDVNIENSEVNVADDLNLVATSASGGNTTGADVTITGQYYGLGNGSTASQSSAIVINGLKSNLDLSGVTKMLIGGVGYVDSDENASTFANTDLAVDESDIMTGETLGLKPNQRAYLVPAQAVAPGYKHGSVNPMTSTQYLALISELDAANGAGMGKSFLVDLDTNIASLGGSLRSVGASGYKMAAYQMESTGLTMVYLFMVFDSSQSAVDYYKNYMNTDITSQRLTDNLAIYTGDTGIKLPTGATGTDESLDFYFGGTMLKSDGAEVIVPEKSGSYYTTNKADIDDVLNNRYATFRALNCNLTTDYYALSDLERNRDVYDNIVKDMVTDMDEAQYIIASGSKKEFEAVTGEKAVVINGDVGSSTFSHYASEGYSLIIASGTVEASADFEGLVIAKETIKLGVNKDLTADPIKVTAALTAVNDDGVMPADYLRNSEYYKLGGSSSASGESTNSLRMEDYVNYANWIKQ